MQILSALFGQNATKVRSIFVTSNAYAAMFITHSDEWEHDTVAYKQERAKDAYWGGK